MPNPSFKRDAAKARRPLTLRSGEGSMKTIWVEILVIIAIILYPVSWALRIIYGRQWLTWEYNLIESWGINQLAYFLAKTGLLIGIAFFFLI